MCVGVDLRDLGPDRGPRRTREERRALPKELGGLVLCRTSFTMGRTPKPPPKRVVDPSDEDESENEPIILSKEAREYVAQIARAWPVGTVAQLEPGHRHFGKDDEWHTVMIIDQHGELGVGLGDVLVHDGDEEIWVDTQWLRRLGVAPELGPRMVAHAHASTSPRCGTSQDPLWDWLSPSGFSSAGMVEAQLPRTSIAHVIGKGGSKIRRLEEHFGVCIGVHDSTKDEATISVIGPSMQLDFVLFVIRGLAQGASSILTHLPLVGCDALPP